MLGLGFKGVGFRVFQGLGFKGVVGLGLIPKNVV